MAVQGPGAGYARKIHFMYGKYGRGLRIPSPNPNPKTQNQFFFKTNIPDTV